MLADIANNNGNLAWNTMYFDIATSFEEPNATGCYYPPWTLDRNVNFL